MFTLRWERRFMTGQFGSSWASSPLPVVSAGRLVSFSQRGRVERQTQIATVVAGVSCSSCSHQSRMDA